VLGRPTKKCLRNPEADGATIIDIFDDQRFKFADELVRHYRPDYDNMPPTDQSNLVIQVLERSNEFMEALRRLHFASSTHLQQRPEPPTRGERDTSHPELYLGALLRAAWALAEREDLTEYADALARYLNVSRKELFSMPLAEFIDRYESAQLTEEINEAYDEELEQEDEEFLAHVRSYQWRVLDDTD
jgi:hypothetical protein